MSSARNGHAAAGLSFSRLRGAAPFHFLCLPGLVPDGPETFERQLRMLRAFGSVVTVSYPDHAFDLDAIIAALHDELERALQEERKPVLVGLSVGGGIALEVIRRRLEAGKPLPLAGIVLISPLTCTADLSPLLSRLMQPIIAESAKEGGRPDIAQERGRQLFKSLVTKATEQVEASHDILRWLGPFGLLLPQGYAAWREKRIIERIQRTFERVPPEGAVARVLALTRFRGLAGLKGPLSEAPTLILWGSKERQTLDMDGPGTGRLCRPDLAYKVFPQVEIHWIYDRQGGEVPHASLLRHAPAFNGPWLRWLRRLARAHHAGVLRRLAAAARVPAP
ncbi:MAG: alpha/beta hydrolase [Planctomycetota bacterium]|nr:alpha/beta hydrolase [Planctomycetota bacterium]MCX8039849.1 alpha/beta hydrolase [Planctomycetota bacterium]MDW8372820.1 alpha/beta hydrolase [Planctomycetota bacterium]